VVDEQKFGEKGRPAVSLHPRILASSSGARPLARSNWRGGTANRGGTTRRRRSVTQAEHYIFLRAFSRLNSMYLLTPTLIDPSPSIASC
jgi:hypothetical protein